MAHRIVSSLRVVDSDGVDKPGTIGRNIVLASGANLGLSVSDNSEIVLTAGYGVGQDDPSVRAKFDQIINGGGGFSGVPYYIGSINLSKTTDGSFFLGVDRCYHFGQFDDNVHPEPALQNTLSILDTCPACTDCPDYKKLKDDTVLVQDAIDGQKDTLMDPTGMLDQYKKTITHWNYVVLMKSWRFNAEATGNEIHASCKYTNHTNAAIPAGLRMVVDFDDGPADIKAFVIDTAVKGTITRNDLSTWAGGGSFDTGSESSSSSRSSESSTPDNAAYLVTKAPLAPGDGIRFYTGALSKAYIGSDQRVTVRFRLTVPSGGTGNYDTGFTTNNMVVIPNNIW